MHSCEWRANDEYLSISWRILFSPCIFLYLNYYYCSVFVKWKLFGESLVLHTPPFTAFKKEQVSHIVQQILTLGKPCITDTGVGGMGKNCSFYKHKHSSSKDTDLKPSAAQETYYT